MKVLTSISNVPQSRMFSCCKTATAEQPGSLQIRNPILLSKPSTPKPSPLEHKLQVAESNYHYCVEKQDFQRALHWASQRTTLRKMLEDVRNGEQSQQHEQQPQQCEQHDDAEKHAQEPQEQHDGGGRQEDSCGRHEGPGVARDGEAHIRRSEEVRPDEDEEGPHRQQEEACAR
jgi:hypothetical protein